MKEEKKLDFVKKIPICLTITIGLLPLSCSNAYTDPKRGIQLSELGMRPVCPISVYVAICVLGSCEF